MQDPAFGATAERIEDALKVLERTSKHMASAKPDDLLAGATPYLRIFGLVAGAAYLGEIALAASVRQRLRATPIRRTMRASRPRVSSPRISCPRRGA
jgi:hypothetical protein